MHGMKECVEVEPSEGSYHGRRCNALSVRDDPRLKRDRMTVPACDGFGKKGMDNIIISAERGRRVDCD